VNHLLHNVCFCYAQYSYTTIPLFYLAARTKPSYC
jgi:hypothetical protein